MSVFGNFRVGISPTISSLTTFSLDAATSPIVGGKMLLQSGASVLTQGLGYVLLQEIISGKILLESGGNMLTQNLGYILQEGS